MDVYEVEISGITHTLQYTDEDAKERGLTKAKKTPANKQAPTPQNKAE